jgi:hypothetical protein
LLLLLLWEITKGILLGLGWCDSCLKCILLLIWETLHVLILELIIELLLVLGEWVSTAINLLSSKLILLHIHHLITHFIPCRIWIWLKTTFIILNWNWLNFLLFFWLIIAKWIGITEYITLSIESIVVYLWLIINNLLPRIKIQIQQISNSLRYLFFYFLIVFFLFF